MVVDKPAGWTSHQVVGRVRRLAGTRKVGHAGTLDPMATGVLLVGVNRATRLLGHLMLTTKTYTGTIRLGVDTVTDDAEGEVTRQLGAPNVSAADLEAALVVLRGAIAQVPTSVSAIKVNGVRSYAAVRAGHEVDLPARPVTVHRLDLLDRRDLTEDGLALVDLDVEVECSSGTYIRALARDLGAALGTGGHLTALRRTQVGPFSLDQARDVQPEGADLGLVTIEDVTRAVFTVLVLTDDQERAVRYGRRLPGLALPAAQTALHSGTGEFLALYRQDGADAVPEAVFVT